MPPHDQCIAKGDSRRMWQSSSARTGPTLDALEVEEGAVVGLRDDGSLIRAAASVSGTPGHAVRPTPNCPSMRHVRRPIRERETGEAGVLRLIIVTVPPRSNRRVGRDQ